MNINSPISTKCRLNSFMTCDAIHVDPATGKHSLLGVFSSLRAKSFPVVHPKMTWFLSLSELHKGKHHLKISMADPTGELETKVIIDRHFESPNPNETINLINQIDRLKFLEAKTYSIVIEVDDEIVFVHSFLIKHHAEYELTQEYDDEEYDDEEYDEYDDDEEYGYSDDDSVF
jgi:hypothetical protein